MCWMETPVPLPLDDVTPQKGAHDDGEVESI